MRKRKRFCSPVDPVVLQGLRRIHVGRLLVSYDVFSCPGRFVLHHHRPPPLIHQWYARNPLRGSLLLTTWYRKATSTKSYHCDNNRSLLSTVLHTSNIKLLLFFFFSIFFFECEREKSIVWQKERRMRSRPRIEIQTILNERRKKKLFFFFLFSFLTKVHCRVSSSPLPWSKTLGPPFLLLLFYRSVRCRTLSSQ